ncbi:phage tail protein [Lysinibacillus fusiformis]|uniref:phage tail protein n=1 Tax=Lysinibacillus fusiformis TaxID=28031 RepID=UPI002D76A281|nr:phage tail protein [Lysinibacillus fusiformis]WRS99881.1 phage tail protein [Lysinibacillus fusiformis]
MVQAQYGTLITNIGLAKIANAQVTQSKVGLENIALGDGNGAHYVPTQNQTALVNEVWRGPVADVAIDPKNNNRITVKAVIPVTIGGFTIREIGVFDNEGLLIAVGQYPEKYKPQLIEGVAEETIIHFVIETNNANVVKLNIDPTVIIASQEYVDKKFNYLDSRIGDTSKLETDCKKDTVGAVNEIQHELNEIVESLGFHEPISSALERGTNEINAPVKTLCSVTGLEGRTIINYAPLFDSGTWTLSENTATTILTVTQPNELNVNVTDITKPIANAWTYITGLVSGKKYIVSMVGNFNAYIDYYTASGLYERVPVYKNKVSLPFTVPTDTSITKMALSIIEPDEGRAVGTFSIKNVMLNEGDTALPFVANMQGITNPTIENIRDNLIPVFHYGGTPYVTGWMNIGAIDAVNVNATSMSGKHVRVLLPVVPGTKYTFACTRNAQIKISTNKGSHWETDQITMLFEESAVQNGNMNCTFTVPTDAYFIRILFIHPTNGFVAYPRMVKGVKPAAYKPQVREALTVKTTLHSGDTLKVDVARQLIKQKATCEMVLDNGLDYTFVAAKTGLKQIGVNRLVQGNQSVYDTSVKALKYNGTLLENTTLNELNVRSDVLYIYGADLRVSIANNDSGWGADYTPTVDEIKAYFMGWKMYDANGGYGGEGDVYNPGGIKGWCYRDPVSSSKVNGLTTTLPNIQAPINGLWQPYKLIYTLKTPVSEIVNTAGSLTLDEGENLLVVSEGRIVQEVATPYYYNLAGYDRYEINTLTKNPLKYNTANILQVYKNGKPDNAWVIEQILNDHVRALIDANLFNPAAVYTVEYLPKEPYCVSAPTNAITIEYADNLGGVIQSLVTTVAKIGAQQNSPSFRFGKDDGRLYIMIDEDVIT